MLDLRFEMRNLAVVITVLSVAIVGARTAGAESPARWFRDGRAAVEEAKKTEPIRTKARNVILFIGDGMGVSTITAARIFDGQRRGMTGEENTLAFETLPYTALVKTYNTNQQTADSAGTMSAIVTGVKTKAGVLSVDQNVIRGDYTTAQGSALTTIFELAEDAGLATGIVSTTRVTHATPAACYAHSVERDWESDINIPLAAQDGGFRDIARQLIEFGHGDGIDLVLGGGRQAFLPNSVPDPEYAEQAGHRKDGRDLTKEWMDRPGSVYVWNTEQFDRVDFAQTRRLLGLFEYSHMQYEYERPQDVSGEPSLSQMTGKAIDFLSRNSKGYVLVVEGARIDHAHHDCNAYRALTDTVEFANAVRVAQEKTDKNNTLLVVTADHSHVFTLGGYATRGNPVLATVVHNNRRGEKVPVAATDDTGKSYTAIGYRDGPGYTGRSSSQPAGIKHYPHRRPEGQVVWYEGIRDGRPQLTNADTEDPNYLQESAIPLEWESHGGEDVALFAGGPNAHLFHGVIEQNVIFHVLVDALGLKARAPTE